MSARRAIALALVVIASSCSSSSSGHAPATTHRSATGTHDSSPSDPATAPGDTAASATPRSATTASTAPASTTTTSPPVQFATGPFDLADPSVGLSALSSYHAALTVTFDGTTSGQPSTWTWSQAIDVTQNPPARSLTEDQTGDSPHHRYSATIGGVHYEQTDVESCSASVPDPAQPTTEPDVATQLTGLIGTDDAGPESVDGVDAHRYTFDERALGSLDAATTTGTVWIATDRGYVTKYSETSVGGSGFLGAGVTGTLTLEYQVTAVDQVPPIAAAAGCPTRLIDIPLPADASAVSSRPGDLRFVTAGAPTDVVTALTTELTTAGWTTVGDQLVGDDAAAARFTQADLTLTLSASTGPTGTSVHVSIDPSS